MNEEPSWSEAADGLRAVGTAEASAIAPPAPRAAAHPATTLGPCEQLGMLMPRLLHDLGNCLTVIAGNTHLARRAASPESQARALAALGEVAERAGEHLERFTRIARAAQDGSSQTTVAHVVQAIAGARPRGAEWDLRAGPATADPVRGLARWHAFAAWEIVRLSRAARGTIAIDLAQPGPEQAAAWSLPGAWEGHPVLWIELQWDSPCRLIPTEEGQRPKATELLVVFELCRWVGGAARYLWAPPGRNRCLLGTPAFEP